MNYKDVKVGMEVIDTSDSGLLWGVGIVRDIIPNPNEDKTGIPLQAQVYFHELYLRGIQGNNTFTGIRYYSIDSAYDDLEEFNSKAIKQEYKGDLDKLKGFLGGLDIEED